MFLTTIATLGSIVVVARMPTSTIALIQEALDAASWDLKHWTAILPFDISSSDSSGALVDSQIPDLFEYAKPMYRGQKVCFAGKYNFERAGLLRCLRAISHRLRLIVNTKTVL